MIDEPTPPDPDEVPPPVRPAPARVDARDIALGTIVFIAALLLLLGGTRLLERTGGGERGGSPSAAIPTIGPASPGPSASDGAPPTGSAAASASVQAIGDPVLVGAGDIGDCTSDGDEQTAALLDGIAGTVFTVGDNAYERGTAEEFRDCYDPTWGRHRDRTRPAPGNHDWETAGLAGYLDYFGVSAQGPDGASWYSYDLGTWHVIVLDSMCDKVGGCDPGSPQGQWLAADLAASDATCTVAMFHHPRFSSGQHGDLREMDAFWRPLYAEGVDVIVNGHDHDYERFAPQDPDGGADPDRGIRQLVVGTGGTRLRNFARVVPNSDVRLEGGFGVLKLTLHDGSYDAEFIAAGNDFRDRGTALPCH